MKNLNKLRLVLATGLALGALAQAHAANLAGDVISNTATVNYKVAAVSQTAVDSNPATFTVDRLIDLTVTADDSLPVLVDPGATGNQLKFTVTNLSNATIAVGLAVAQLGDGIDLSPALAEDDGLDMENFSFYVDANNNGSFDTGEDITVIPSLGPNDSVVVYAVAKTPDTAANGLNAGVSILVTALETALGNAVITENTGLDDPMVVDTVFADGNGPLPDDLTGDDDKDGKISAYSVYQVRSADLTIYKTSRVVWDPVNLFVNPKAIPGAYIEYCLVVKNDGTADASDVVVSDPIPVETTYRTGTLYAGLGGDAISCTAPTGGDTALSEAVDADAGAFATTVLQPKGVVTVTTSSVGQPAGRYHVVFQVELD